MGGGLPISCVIGKAEVMDKVTPGTLGGTYGGNPVACAAALATIRRMEELCLNARGEQIGTIIRSRFESIAASVPEVSDVRGLGAMMAIEFSEPGDPTKPGKHLVDQIISRCRDNGLLVIPAGVYGNVIRVLSPIVISDDELRRSLDILENAVTTLVSHTSQTTV
jgi:4-aminobutyrate aminotransferase/(S)-3-amino-2-methylpropionate transaminase